MINMDDLIRREEAIDCLRRAGALTDYGKYLIEHLEAADVEKHGYWMLNTDDFTPHIRCSDCKCNKPVLAGEGIKQEPANYCNKCRAKMDKVAQPKKQS